MAWTLGLQIPDGLAWAAVGVLGTGGMALAAWLLNKVASHDSRISVLEVVVGLRKRREKQQ